MSQLVASASTTPLKPNNPVDCSKETYDVVIIGAGAAGLVAALRAHFHGLRPLLVEKSTHVGGASAVSGGGVWIPNNHLSQSAGIKDSIANALEYLETIIDDVGSASSRERKIAFLTEGPKMAKWLEDEGFRWVHSTGYPDYYVERDGGAVGRTIEGTVFDLKNLGDWEDFMLIRKAAGAFAMHTFEYRFVVNFKRTWEAFGAFLIVILRTIFWKFWGCLPVTLGMSLVAQLLLLVKLRGIEVRRDCPMIKLHVDDGKVAGVVVKKDGVDTLVRANRGVMLCAGGFAKNAAMRQKHTKGPVSDMWTSVPDGDMGCAIQAGQEVGGAVALLDDAWWGPTFVNPQTGETHFALVERSLPHSIIVDSHGKRFMNESQSYVDCGHAQYERHQTVPGIPAWFIFDSQHRNKYMMWSYPPGKTPDEAFSSGLITRGATLSELAGKIKIDAGNLVLTVQRFNAMASVGKDEDFNRGDHFYDRYFGDASSKPNPNLGPLVEAPFYAIQVWPGDLGTKGGLVTDEFGRVIREDGTPIQGLYAAGNSSASVMGRTYPGAGGTLGPAMTFAFAAMNHVAEIKEH
ncbi:fumarate reductase/succinate dehydrogenase flavo protein [Cadophora sp. DSE1049]|nr:fumarate reductase/succinate dehydrogenase flavo protein [Cadophora sp. DSE1049]